MSPSKRIAVFLTLAFVGANLSAQESGFTFRPLFSGGGPTAALHGFGGKGEAAFLFYDRGLQISSHVVGRGSSVAVDGDSYGAGSVSARLSFGGFWPGRSFRSYTFAEGGIGAAGGSGGAHLASLFGGGGGFDWLFAERSSVYIELGYLQHHINNRFAGSPTVSIGARSFF